MRPEDLADLTAALEQFQEATRRARQLKVKAKLERELEKAMQVAFRAQGKVLARRFKAWKDRFPVAEAVGPEGWEDLWELLASETFKRFEEPIKRAILRSFKAGAASANSADSGLSFDLKNPRAKAWLKDRAAERVTMTNETTRDSIGGLVNTAIAEGWSYDRIAREISDRFEAFAVGKPQKHVDSRAHLVAITEVGEAYSEGNLQMGQQLQAAGLEMEKSWLDSGDDKVSAGCRDNAAAGWIPLDDDFPSGHKRPLRFPGCRCDILIQRKRK